jgi:ketosteroid isomerase-like protein
MVTKDAKWLAEQLQAEVDTPQEGEPSVMSSLYADTIDLRHVPPRSADGPIEASLMREISVADMDAVSRGLLERTFDPPSIKVEGDSVRIRSAMRGTLATGEAVTVNNDVLLEVRDGKIVALEAHRDDESWSNWFKILKAGKFDPPQAWLDRGGHTPENQS